MAVRIGTKLSDAHRKAISDGLRKAMAAGWKPKPPDWRHGLESITPEARKRAAKAAGKVMKGRPQNMNTVCGKHRDNKAAKWWKFENKALGKTIEGKNLNQLIRDDESLFDPADLVWDKSGCNASRCLRLLKNSKRKPTYIWKGWVIKNISSY